MCFKSSVYPDHSQDTRNRTPSVCSVIDKFLAFKSFRVRKHFRKHSFKRYSWEFFLLYFVCAWTSLWIQFVFSNSCRLSSPPACRFFDFLRSFRNLRSVYKRPYWSYDKDRPFGGSTLLAGRTIFSPGRFSKRLHRDHMFAPKSLTSRKWKIRKDLEHWPNHKIQNFQYDVGFPYFSNAHFAFNCRSSFIIFWSIETRHIRSDAKDLMRLVFRLWHQPIVLLTHKVTSYLSTSASHKSISAWNIRARLPNNFLPLHLTFSRNLLLRALTNPYTRHEDNNTSTLWYVSRSRQKFVSTFLM